MTPLSVLSLIPASIEQVKTFSDYIIEECNEGNQDPLDIYMKCIAMEKTAESIKKAIQKKATDEAEKYGKGEHEKNSFKFKTGEVGVKYLFEESNDPILKKYSIDFDNSKSRLDERKNFLKNIKEAIRIVDEETGDSMVINPIPKTSTTSVIVSMK